MTALLHHPEYLLLAALGVFTIGLAWYAYWLVRFLVRLNRHEHGTWVTLGEPVPGWNRGALMRLQTYLGRGEYRALGDGEAVRLGDCARSAKRAFLGAMILACVLAVAVISLVRP